MNHKYHLSVSIDGIQEDAEEKVLSILSARKNDKQFSLAIEGHLPICSKEYQHIQNEQCEIEEEMRRTHEYWENHDCSEEEHEEHE